MTLQAVVMVDGRPRERYDASRDRAWHSRFYRALDLGYSQADARDLADMDELAPEEIRTPRWMTG